MKTETTRLASCPLVQRRWKSEVGQRDGKNYLVLLDVSLKVAQFPKLTRRLSGSPELKIVLRQRFRFKHIQKGSLHAPRRTTFGLPQSAIANRCRRYHVRFLQGPVVKAIHLSLLYGISLRKGLSSRRCTLTRQLIRPLLRFPQKTY